MESSLKAQVISMGGQAQKQRKVQYERPVAVVLGTAFGAYSRRFFVHP